jgi:hypothetical protein
VILLVLVVVLWICVLAPSAWRRYAERQGVGSIDHFHHQLELLEHAGPKLVAPAYRLHTALPGGAGTQTSVSRGVDPSRPKLVLVRPTSDEASADVDDDDGVHYERVGVLESPLEPIRPSEPHPELLAYRRQQCRQRCTHLLRCLTGMAIATGLLGLVPSFRLAWIFTAITGLGALALVGLIAYAKELEDQRQRQRSPRPGRAVAPEAQSAASSGLPGAWDQEYDYRQQAAL